MPVIVARCNFKLFISSELRVGSRNEHHMRHRQNGEFEAYVVDFSQFTEPNIISRHERVTKRIAGCGVGRVTTLCKHTGDSISKSRYWVSRRIAVPLHLKSIFVNIMLQSGETDAQTGRQDFTAASYRKPRRGRHCPLPTRPLYSASKSLRLGFKVHTNAQ
jgi:hypothetical protein